MACSLYYGGSTLPHRKLAVSGLTNKETLLNAEKTKYLQDFGAVGLQGLDY